VEERLAACVQVAGPITSVYRWEGEIRTEVEWVIEAKTREASHAALIARLRELHPHEVPEILLLPVTSGHPPYMEWIARETE
jgi:periplasmic divalent cation tolerance protein